MLEWIVGAALLGGAADFFGSDRKRSPKSKKLHAASNFPEQTVRPPPRPKQVDGGGDPKNRHKLQPEHLGYDGLDTQSDSCSIQPPPIPLGQKGVVSTTRLGPLAGVKAKPFLFDEFIRLGLLIRVAKCYEHTEIGRRFGGPAATNCGAIFAAWDPKMVLPALLPLRRKMLEKHSFRLFHMTHADNLVGILQLGLQAHDCAPEHVDISNPSVQERRNRCETIHGRSLHGYVPLYFNCRNAMLYEKQLQHRSKLVILEISREACLAERVVFSEGNAATTAARFEFCLNALLTFDWQTINAKTWVIDRVKHLEIKRLMQSECLIPKEIPSDQIETIHVIDEDSAAIVHLYAKSTGRSTPIRVSPELFFEV
jgi:hypothetical protein